MEHILTLIGQAVDSTGHGDLLRLLSPMLIVFVIFYFLMIRPQQQKMKNKGSDGHQMTKKISETRCTCNSCQNVWHYGMKDVLSNLGAASDNCGNTASPCGCCGGASKQKIVDLDKCPKCGSRNIKKEKVVHEVSL